MGSIQSRVDMKRSAEGRCRSYGAGDEGDMQHAGWAGKGKGVRREEDRQEDGRRRKGRRKAPGAREREKEGSEHVSEWIERGRKWVGGREGGGDLASSLPPRCLARRNGRLSHRL